MTQNKCVLEIVRDYLTSRGYDGLFNTDLGCACLHSDLAPCSQIGDECEAGYRKDYRAGEECGCDARGDGDHFHVQPEKP